MREYCKEIGIYCPTYDQCHHREICAAHPHYQNIQAHIACMSGEPLGRREKEKPMFERMLEQLKNLNLERMDLDFGVSLAAFGRIMEAEYQQVGAEAPDWLTDNLKALRKEIRQRLQDTLESRLVEINSRLDSLSTVEEKREKLKAEAQRLREKLGASA